MIAFKGLVTQMPAATLVEPGDLLNPLIKILYFLEPFLSFSGDSLHVFTKSIRRTGGNILERI